MATYSFINKPAKNQQIVRGDQPNRFANKQTETDVNSFESYNKNLKTYPYTITETSPTITTIAYTTPTGTITKTITEVSSTTTTIAIGGVGTKTIVETSPTLTTISYS
jgi:hypothetical protein